MKSSIRSKIYRLYLIGLICLCCLAGCGKGDSFQSSGLESADSAEDTETQRKDTDSAAPPQAGISGSLFDSGKFAGKITSVKYAGPGRLLVCADHLSLYDAQTDQIVGEYRFSEEGVQLGDFYALSDGYALFGEFPENTAGGAEAVPEGDSGSAEYVTQDFAAGMSEVTENREGLRCWLFDGNLDLQRSIDLHGLLREQGYDEMIEMSAAISKDGTQIAVCGTRKLYRYDVERNTFRVLLDVDSETESGGLRHISASRVRFTGREEGSSSDAEGLIFTGIAIPEGSSNSVPIYGTMNLDGSGLNCRTVSDYALSDEIIAYENEIWFPEDFQYATGKLMVTDRTGQVIRTVDLEGEDTGEDGIFGSDTGKYIATAGILGDLTEWNGGWRIRIYDAESGKIVWEQNVGTDTSAYSGLSCRVKILDGLRECIVICGRNENTATSAWFF